MWHMHCMGFIWQHIVNRVTAIWAWLAPKSRSDGYETDLQRKLPLRKHPL